MEEIKEEHDDNLDIGATGRSSAGDRDESPLNSAKYYVLVVRMADGSSRVINQASPANWRPGERVMIIEGTNSSRR
jgi:outer membrane lipoprotein SlyB